MDEVRFSYVVTEGILSAKDMPKYRIRPGLGSLHGLFRGLPNKEKSSVHEFCLPHC